LLCVALFLAACSGLAGEPPIVATIPPAFSASPTSGLPPENPDLLQGAQIYAENCTRCHGEAGRGDGQLVLSGQLDDPPLDFTDPATSQGQTLMDWYSTITNGRLEKLMPPWGDALSEQERWAAAYYTYTMAYQLEQVKLGQVVWDANCAACHGVSGEGDGPRTSELNIPLSNLAAAETLVNQSDDALFELITRGQGDAMPAFGDTLDEPQRRQVVAYLRTLSLENADLIGQTVPAPAATAEVEAAPSVPGRISGQITNGTAGSKLDSELIVTLYVIDSQLNQQTRETVSASDGTFSFDDVPLADNFAYRVTTSYQARIFSSDMVRGDRTAGILDIPIMVYDVTDDPSVITINDITMQISAISDILQITAIINFRNNSDHLFSQNEMIAGSHFASIEIPVPPGAQIQGIANETQRYLLSEDGSTLMDMRPVYPGTDHIVHITYTLPFDGQTDIEIPLQYALSGSVQLLVQSGNLSISTPQLMSQSPQTMGDSTFQSYGADLSLPVGEKLRYSIMQTAQPISPIAPNNALSSIFIGLGSLAILIALGLYIYEQRFARPTANNQPIIDLLIEQIAELDDMHQRKEINTQAYQTQRKRLKERLASLMQKK